MRLGIFAKTFPGTDPMAVLTAARDAGYDCVQWNWACAGLESMPESIPTRALDATRRAVDATGIDIVAVSGTFNMIHPDADVREAGLLRLETIARHAQDIGASLVTLCTGTRHSTDQWEGHRGNASEAAWEDLLESLEHAVSIAEHYRIRLGIEPERANVIDGVERAQRLFDAAPDGAPSSLQSARLRIVIDAANLAETGDSESRKPLIESAVAALAPHIEIAHAKDRCTDGVFATVGDGAIDFAHYLGCLEKAGFDGPVVTHGLSEADAPRVASTLRELLNRGNR